MQFGLPTQSSSGLVDNLPATNQEQLSGDQKDGLVVKRRRSQLESSNGRCILHPAILQRRPREMEVALVLRPPVWYEEQQL
jgi:hypothetical protein